MTAIRIFSVLKKEGVGGVSKSNKDKIFPKEKRAYLREIKRNQTLQVNIFPMVIPIDLSFLGQMESIPNVIFLFLITKSRNSKLWRLSSCSSSFQKDWGITLFYCYLYKGENMYRFPDVQNIQDKYLKLFLKS